jgi:hypothetical protein
MFAHSAQQEHNDDTDAGASAGAEDYLIGQSSVWRHAEHDWRQPFVDRNGRYVDEHGRRHRDAGAEAAV